MAKVWPTIPHSYPHSVICSKALTDLWKDPSGPEGRSKGSRVGEAGYRARKNQPHPKKLVTTRGPQRVSPFKRVITMLKIYDQKYSKIIKTEGF